MKRWLKSLASAALGEYDLYRIFSCDHASVMPVPNATATEFASVNAEAIAASEDEIIRAQAWYAGDGASAYACVDHGRIVALCIYWYGERYRKRGYWPLAANEAKLVQIICVPEMRGRGLARRLIQYSTAQMMEQGYKRLFARVWFTNVPSVKAFRAAGWRQIACVLRVNPLRRAHPMRLTIGRRPSVSQ